MIANLSVNTLGILIFLFLYWKKLKEDLGVEIIFSSAYIIIGAILASYFMAIKFLPNWIFWMEILGLILSLSFSIYKFKMKIFETLDATVISLLPWLSLTFLKDSVVNASIASFISFVSVLIFIFIYYFVDSRYKRFTWYRSGKIGFSGLFTLFVFFLVRSTTSLIIPSVLTFTSVFEPYISGALSLLSILVILYLGRIEE